MPDTRISSNRLADAFTLLAAFARIARFQSDHDPARARATLDTLIDVLDEARRLSYDSREASL